MALFFCAKFEFVRFAHWITIDAFPVLWGFKPVGGYCCAISTRAAQEWPELFFVNVDAARGYTSGANKKGNDGSHLVGVEVPFFKEVLIRSC